MRANKGISKKRATAAPLVHSYYIVYGHRISQDNFGQPYRVQIGFMCPVCMRFHGSELEHGVEFICECGLHITRYGNELACTEEVVECQ